MKIVLASLLSGAREAKGTAIIIDVYRAFTTAPIAFLRGAEKIVLVAEIAEALELRRQGVGEICIGEVGGMRPDGFDYGNSPYEISQADLEGKTIIQSTRAGTVGVAAASNADHIYGASLVTAAATAKVVLKCAPELVTVVAMGGEGKVRSDEDEQCALYIRNLLQGRQPDRDAVRKLVLAGSESQKFGDPKRPHFHAKDREMALLIDSLSFTIRVRQENGLLVARPEYV